MKELMDQIGYHFRDESLLKMGLTHPSMGGKDNQRLEFLGDAILQYIMSERLYLAYPKEREGGLTHRRAKLVCEAALSEIGGTIGLGKHIRMEKGEESSGGRDKPSILADGVEALLAAVYLDGGMEAAKTLAARLWPSLDMVLQGTQDFKGALQEHLQGKGRETPTYELIEVNGPPHERVFTAAVFADGAALAKGVGKTKKQAEQEAAKCAYARLTGKGDQCNDEA